MFKITHFDKRLCQLMHRQHLHAMYENICDIYSIWNFCPRTRWQAVTNFYCGKFPCRPQHFAIIYWLVLIISVIGSIYSLLELKSMFLRGPKQLVMWRKRIFYVLPPAVLRKCRFVGAFIQLNSWLLLLYAVIKVSPGHMTPWLTITMSVLCAEFIIWLSEVFLGVYQLELNTVLSFFLATLSYLFVQCVQSVFLQAIEMNDIENLSLWKIF